MFYEKDKPRKCEVELISSGIILFWPKFRIRNVVLVMNFTDMTQSPTFIWKTKRAVIALTVVIYDQLSCLCRNRATHYFFLMRYSASNKSYCHIVLLNEHNSSKSFGESTYILSCLHLKIIYHKI